MTHSVAIVDDHALLAEVLAGGLRRSGYDVDIVRPTPTLMADLAERTADLVLVDIELGDGLPSGIDVVAQLRLQGTDAVMLTGVVDEVTLGHSLLAGASGIIHKREDFDTLLSEVQAAVEGGPVTPGSNERARLTALAMGSQNTSNRSPLPELTDREAAVLDGLVQGLSVSEIADRSYVAVSTIRTQIKSMRRKLGVRSQLQAVTLALEHGWDPGSVDPV